MDIQAYYNAINRRRRNRTTATRALELGVPIEIIRGSSNILKLTEEELRTEHCEMCGNVMRVHDDARWRFIRHRPIRCIICAETLILGGESEFDAYYVM